MSFSTRLKAALKEIHAEDCPPVPNPPGCKKRASVAIVLRIRPNFPQRAIYDPNDYYPPNQDFKKVLDGFFSQVWVSEGEPEVLLIKRAARVGDRWTSHIALPGGKRELGDPSDRDTSARETREETGLEVDIDHCLYVGNLPERTITTAWGKVPLMVLCPFVYLQMRHDLPPLALQPSEVHSAHWVPLKGLLLPSLRRDISCDVSDRFVRQRTPLVRTLIRAAVGQLVFGAVKLRPTESLYCKPNAEIASESQAPTLLSHFIGQWLGVKQVDENDQPLLLWGLTLGVMADLLELIDRPATSRLWRWPTFSPWDIQIVIWLLNRRFQFQRLKELTRTASDLDEHEVDGIQVGGLDNTTYSTSIRKRGKGSEAGITGMMLLEDYTDRLRRAVVVAVLIRFTFGTVLTAYLIRRYRRS